MNKERTILRNLKASHKAELAWLKNFSRELSRNCKQHHTHKDHSDAALMKAKHDSEFYKNRIKDINDRLKELSAK